MTLNLDFKVIIDALDVLCAQLTRDMFAIAKFLFHTPLHSAPPLGGPRQNIAISFGVAKLEWWDYTIVKKTLMIMYNRLLTIPGCDGRTDRHLATA